MPPDTAQDNPANWSADATLRQQDYFNQYLDRKKSPGDTEFEPALGKLLTNLYDRQRQEAYGLLDQATGRLSPDGERREILKEHKEEFRQDYSKQCQGFVAERERYIREYREARRSREDMDTRERREALEHGPDQKGRTP